MTTRVRMAEASDTDQSDLTAYDYELPAELVAQEPAPCRDGSRLMVVDRESGGVGHHRIADLADLVGGDDLLVFNDVRVRSARLRGRSPSGGGIELLLLREDEPGVWECLGRPGRRLRAGAAIELPDGQTARVLEHGGGRTRVSFATVGDVGSFLERFGEIPLPPYIKRPGGPSERDRERYQTIFARRVGAVAAPTAGLHFTEGLLERLRDRGTRLAWVTLDVGPATFLPPRADTLDDYHLEAEWASIPEETVRAIASTRAAGGRVVAVGTTTTRALESRAAMSEGLTPGGFWAGAFLREPGQFRVVDGLLTNFHLPKSTLLVLVSAFAGRRRILAAYQEAVRHRYRFYSYGDAMLIL